MIAIGRRQWKEAASSHRQALKLFQKLGDARKAAWSLQNTGYALGELNELDKAKYHLKNAAKTLQQLQDHHHLAIVWMNLANVLVKQGKFQSAYELLVASQKIFEKHSDLLHQAHVLTNQGIVLLGLDEPLTAQSMFNRAAVLYKVLNDLVWHINALDGLVMALTASGQYLEAIQIADQALAILPQIRSSAYYENLLGKLTEHRSEAEPLVSVTA
jgi:tetratricopeptide (TPR) repeat protein